MPETTTWPHEDLMAENKITTADLSAATNRKIEKFKKETDNDLKETLDEVIYGEVLDVVEKKNKEAKDAAVKKQHADAKAAKAAASKNKKDDISSAPTAAATTPPAGDGNTPPPAGPPPPAPKRNGVLGTILGRGNG